MRVMETSASPSSNPIDCAKRREAFKNLFYITALPTIIPLLWYVHAAAVPIVTGPDRTFYDCRVISQSIKEPFSVRLKCIPPCDVQVPPPPDTAELVRAGVDPRIAGKIGNINVSDRNVRCVNGTAARSCLRMGREM